MVNYYETGALSGTLKIIKISFNELKSFKGPSHPCSVLGSRGTTSRISRCIMQCHLMDYCLLCTFTYILKYFYLLIRESVSANLCGFGSFTNSLLSLRFVGWFTNSVNKCSYNNPIQIHVILSHFQISE